jgi:hypothetical protein
MGLTRSLVGAPARAFYEGAVTECPKSQSTPDIFIPHTCILCIQQVYVTALMVATFFVTSSVASVVLKGESVSNGEPL